MLWSLPFVALVVLVLPYLAWSSARQLAATDMTAESLPSARAMSVQVLIIQAVVFWLAALAVYGAGVAVTWPSRLSLTTVLLAFAVVAMTLALAVVEARRPVDAADEAGQSLRRVSPGDPVWLLATTAAAFVEEFAYRGVLTNLLATHTGPLVAAVVSAALFGLAHLSQGYRGALVATVFALALQVVVYASGGLLLAVAVHFAYDFLAAWLGYYWRKADASRDNQHL